MLALDEPSSTDDDNVWSLNPIVNGWLGGCCCCVLGRIGGGVMSSFAIIRPTLDKLFIVLKNYVDIKVTTTIQSTADK